jgi:hypothetical protein
MKKPLEKKRFLISIEADGLPTEVYDLWASDQGNAETEAKNL